MLPKREDAIKYRQPVIVRSIFSKFSASSDDGLSVYQVKLLLELEAVLESCGLVEYKLLSSAVWILEEVTYTLELNCDT